MNNMYIKIHTGNSIYMYTKTSVKLNEILSNFITSILNKLKVYVSDLDCPFLPIFEKLNEKVFERNFPYIFCDRSNKCPQHWLDTAYNSATTGKVSFTKEAEGLHQILHGAWKL